MGITFKNVRKNLHQSDWHHLYANYLKNNRIANFKCAIEGRSFGRLVGMNASQFTVDFVTQSQVPMKVLAMRQYLQMGDMASLLYIKHGIFVTPEGHEGLFITVEHQGNQYDIHFYNDLAWNRERG